MAFAEFQKQLEDKYLEAKLKLTEEEQNKLNGLLEIPINNSAIIPKNSFKKEEDYQAFPDSITRFLTEQGKPHPIIDLRDPDHIYVTTDYNDDFYDLYRSRVRS